MAILTILLVWIGVFPNGLMSLIQDLVIIQ
jgi:hypothetical protein